MIFNRTTVYNRQLMQPNTNNSQPDHRGVKPNSGPVYPEASKGPLGTDGPKFATNNQQVNKNKKKEEVKSAIYTILLFILAPIFEIFIIVFVLQS